MGTALVVEDCLTDLQIITCCLQQEGIKVLTADSGEEALTKLSTQTPDVIVLDIVLPGRSGFEVCRDIKDATNTKSIPVVICSTKSGEMDNSGA